MAYTTTLDLNLGELNDEELSLLKLIITDLPESVTVKFKSNQPLDLEAITKTVDTLSECCVSQISLPLSCPADLGRLLNILISVLTYSHYRQHLFKADEG